MTLPTHVLPLDQVPTTALPLLMPWTRAQFKEKDVWVEVDEAGALKADGGRVPMRYSDKSGAKIYRAGAANVTIVGKKAEALPDGVSADAAQKAKKKGKGSGFGKAGTRTKAQAGAAREAAAELLKSFSDDVVVAFTDGACQGNPGPCGAGAVVKTPDGQVLEKYASLGVGTNNIGELSAIGLALDLIEEAGTDADIEMLTDSKYTHGVLSLGWKAKKNTDLILGLRKRLKGKKVRLHWVAGHVGIPENERADALAVRGAEESKR